MSRLKRLRHFNAGMYNNPVSAWRRAVIAVAFTINLDLGGRVLWRLAPYGMVG